VSSNLPATTGGGAVVSLPAGDVTPAANVGDMSIDRGTTPATTGYEPLIRDLQRAVGLKVSPTQIKAAQEMFVRNRLAEDHRQRTAAEAAIKSKWGAATEGSLIKIHGWLLDTMGKELAHELLGARDDAGTGICNKPAVLEAMLKAAQATPAKRTNDNNDGGAHPDQSAISSARLREIDGWMGSRDARYWKDETVQSEYRELLDRGVTGDVMPNTADADVARRIAELEKWMGARRGSTEYRKYYDDPAAQEEYRQLQRRRQRSS
jgi:hypothetical protein